MDPFRHQFRRRCGQLLPLAAIVGAGSLTLLLIPRGEFLWTDIAEIREGATTAQSLRDLGNALLHGLADFHYRPIVFALNFASWRAFGTDPFLHRVVNWAIHCANSWMTFVVIAGTLRKRAVALAGAMLMAVHPVALTELAVAGLRSELLSVLGTLLTLECVRRYTRSSKLFWLWWGILFYLLALGSKETAAASLPVVLLFGVETRDHRRRSICALVALSVATAGWLVLRLNVAGTTLTRPEGWAGLPAFGTEVVVFARYAAEFAVPTALTVCDAVVVPEAPYALVVAGVGALAAVAAIIIRLMRARRYDYLFLLVWAACALVPISGIVPLKHIRADRYLYALLPATCGLTAALLSDATFRSRRGILLFNALVVAGIGYLATAFWLRAVRFSSNEALWGYETRVNPYCAEGWSFLAREYLLRDEREKGRDAISRVHRYPHVIAFFDAQGVLFLSALLHAEDGLVVQATDELRTLARGATTSIVRGEAYYQLSLLALSDREYARAEDALTHALAEHLALSSQADAYLLRSYARAQTGQTALAREDLETSEKLSPGGWTSPFRRAIASTLREMLAHPSFPPIRSQVSNSGTQ